MADNEAENVNEAQEASGEELKAKVTELENQLVKKDDELAEAQARIAELEKAVAEADERVSLLRKNLDQAVSNYKAQVVKSNPGVLAELVTGSSVEEIDNSLVSARELVSKVRSGIEAEISKVKVPVGAPQRASIDLSVLTPREKIQYAIGGKK